MTLIPSKKCEAFIKGFEQCRLHAYLPTPDDVPTIGWGSTGSDIRLGLTWTQQQADERFAADLAHFAGKVALLIGSTATTQGEFDALVSLAYNIGTGPKGLGGSTLLRLHNAGDKAEAAKQFVRWNKQRGKVLNGLTRRREGEAAMYRGQV